MRATRTLRAMRAPTSDHEPKAYQVEAITRGLMAGEASMSVVAAESGTPLRKSERKIGTAEQSHTGRAKANRRAVPIAATERVGNTRAIRAGEAYTSMSSATRTPRRRKGTA